MCGTRRAPLPAALHSRPEPRACSGTLIGAGWHRSPPLRAEIDANMQVRTTASARSTPIARLRSNSGRGSGSMCGTRRAPLPFALHSRSERRACSGTHFRTGVASIAAAPGGDRCERASENDRLGPLDTHRPPSFQLRPGKRVDVWHPTSAVALRTALSLRAASVQWHPHWRGVASIAAAPGGDRCERASENDRLGPLDTHRPPSFQLRPGKRVDVWHPTSAVALRTALSLRAASVQWHPASAPARTACIDPRAGQCTTPPPHPARGAMLRRSGPSMADVQARPLRLTPTPGRAATGPGGRRGGGSRRGLRGWRVLPGRTVRWGRRRE